MSPFIKSIVPSGVVAATTVALPVGYKLAALSGNSGSPPTPQQPAQRHANEAAAQARYQNLSRSTPYRSAKRW